MDSPEVHQPMPRDELLRMVEYAKSFDCLANAMPIINWLEYRYRGIYAPDDWALIDSIKAHYTEDARREALERASAQIEARVNARLGIPELSVDDDTITAAIVQVMSADCFNSSRDWAAIYRILADFCGYPKVYSDFKSWIDTLYFGNAELKYPLNDVQSVQKGLSSDWPQSYKKWQTHTTTDKTFLHRKAVAELFLRCLKVQQRKQEESDSGLQNTYA